MPEEATSEYADRVKEAYPSMNGFRKVEAEGAWLSPAFWSHYDATSY